MTSPSSQFLCFGHETTHSLGLRPVLGLLLYIFRSFSNVSCWASPPIRVLLKWAARGQVDSVARLCPSQARKLPPPTHGLRANSGFRASLDRLLIKGKPTPVLGLCNLSFLSFILIQGRDAVEKLNTEPGREVRAPKIEMSRSSARNVIKSHEIKLELELGRN